MRYCTKVSSDCKTVCFITSWEIKKYLSYFPYLCYWVDKLRKIYEMLWVIWYHLSNLKNMINTHGGVLILEYSFWMFFTFFFWMVPNRATYHICNKKTIWLVGNSLITLLDCNKKTIAHKITCRWRHNFGGHFKTVPKLSFGIYSWSESEVHYTLSDGSKAPFPLQNF